MCFGRRAINRRKLNSDRIVPSNVVRGSKFTGARLVFDTLLKKNMFGVDAAVANPRTMLDGRVIPFSMLVVCTSRRVMLCLPPRSMNVYSPFWVTTDGAAKARDYGFS